MVKAPFGKATAKTVAGQQRHGSPSLQMGRTFVSYAALSLLLYGGFALYMYQTEAEKMQEKFQDWERMQKQQDEEEQARVRR